MAEAVKPRPKPKPNTDQNHENPIVNIKHEPPSQPVEIIQEELLVDDHASVSPENEIEIDASIDLEQKEEAEISELKENIAAPEVAPPSHMPDEPLAQVQLPQNDDVDIADDNWVHIYPTLSPTSLDSSVSDIPKNPDTLYPSLARSITEEDFEAELAEVPPLLQTIPVTAQAVLVDLSDDPEAITCMRLFDMGLFGPFTNSAFYQLVKQFHGSQYLLESVVQAIDTQVAKCRREEQNIWEEEKHTKEFAPKGCGDGVELRPERLTWETARLNELGLSTLRGSLEYLRELTFRDSMDHTFAARMARLRVESHIDEYLFRTALFNKLSSLDPVIALPNENRKHLDEEEMKILRHMIDILFYFERQSVEANEPIESNEFRLVIRKCITQLMGVLLRCATYSDHLYVANHLVSCGRIDSWAATFLQLPQSPQWTILDVEHFLSVTKVILSRVLSAPVSSTHPKLEPSLADHPELFALTEEDLTSLFKQLPFALFAHNVLADVSQSPDRVAEVQSRLALAERLLSTLTSSLLHFKSFRDFSKRISETVVQLIQAVETFGETAIMTGMNSGDMIFASEVKSKLDQYFLKSFRTLVREPSLWQFIVHLPFEKLHPTSSSYIFSSLFFGYCDEPLLQLVSTANEETWFKIAKRENFVRLVTSDHSAEFLLHVLARIAASHTCSGKLSEIIVTELFMASYILSETKETIYKTGKDMLATVCRAFPRFIAHLIDLTDANMTAIGKGCFHLFNSLPLRLLQPRLRTLETIEKWINCDLPSDPCKLGQYIVSQINWELDPSTGAPVVGKGVHRQVALMVSRALANHQQQSTVFRSLISKELSQFHAWASRTLLQTQAFDLQGNSLLPPLSAGVASVQALASKLPQEKQLVDGASVDPVLAYPMLEYSEIGHNPANFLTTGLAVLKSMISQKYTMFAMRILFDLIPVIISADAGALMPEETPLIVGQLSFARDILLPLLSVQDGWFRLLSTQRNPDIPPQVDLVASMVVVQVMRAYEAENHYLANMILAFWTRELTSLDEWWREIKLCHVLDALIGASFRIGGDALALERLKEAHRAAFVVFVVKIARLFLTFLSSGSTNKMKSSSPLLPGILGQFVGPLIEETGGIFASLFGTNKGNKTIPFPWLTLLVIEIGIEDQKGAWEAAGASICKSMFDNRDISKEIIAGKWMIYALSTAVQVIDVENPIFIIYWQLFFSLFFSRSGHLFFAQRLLNAARKISKIEGVHARVDFIAQTIKTSTSEPQEAYRLQLSQTLLATFLAAKDWLSTDLTRFRLEMLNNMSESKYQIPRFTSAMNYSGYGDVWRDLIDLSTLRALVETVGQQWMEQFNAYRSPKNIIKSASASSLVVSGSMSPNAKLAIEFSESQLDPFANNQFMDPIRLAEYAKAPPPVILVIPRAEPYPVKNKDFFDFIVELVQELTEKSDDFKNLITDRIGRDNAFLDLLPRLFVNVKKTVRNVMRCRQSCKLPVEFVAEIYKKKKQPHIEQNITVAREQQFLLTAKMADTFVSWKLCETALKAEKSIQQLLLLHGREEADVVRSSNLFFTLIDLLSGTSTQFAPARSTVDTIGMMLAKAFISNDPAQTGRFLYALLQDEHKANQFGPLFHPILSPDTFAAMYRVVLDKSGHLDSDVIANLMRRFDIVAWLNGSSNKDVQQDLLKIIGAHLARPLPLPANVPIPTAIKDMPSTWAEALPHFGLVASHQFPVHLNFVLQFVFDNSRKKNLASHLWPLLLDLPLAEGLNPAQVSHIFTWMVEYFKVMRRQNMELVQAWGSYMPQFTRLLSLLVEALIQHHQSVGDQIKTITGNLLTIYQVFIFPAKDGGQDWGANEITSAAFLMRSLVDPLKRMINIFPTALEVIWRWLMAVAQSSELSLKQQSVLYNSDWTKLPWFNVGIPPAQAIGDILKLLQSYIPASPMYGFALQLLHASYRVAETPEYLRAVFDITLFVLATSPWPVAAPFAAFLKSSTQLNWSKLPADQVSKSTFVPQFVFQRYKSGASKYTQAITGTLDVEYDPTRQPDPPNSENSLRLLVTLRFIRQALCWENFDPQATGRVALDRIDHYLLYSAVVLELAPLCYNPVFAAAMVAEILSRANALAAVLYATFFDPEQQEYHLTTDRLIRILQRVVGILNEESPGGVHGATLQTIHDFVSKHSSLALLLMRAASSSYVFFLGDFERELVESNGAFDSVAAVVKLPLMYEWCLESDLFGYQDWIRPVSSLVVPDIGHQAFLEQSVEVGAILVLHTYSLQVMQRNVELEIHQLVDLMLGWVNKLKVPVGSEWKILLLWSKTVLALFWQLCRQDAIDPTRAAQLEYFALFALKESEDKRGGGLLGIIGLGEKSAYALEFRLTARVLGTFVLSQIGEGIPKAFRRSRQEPIPQSARSKSNLQALLSLAVHQEYKDHELLIQNAHAFITNPAKTLHNIDELMLLACSGLYKSPIKTLFGKM